MFVKDDKTFVKSLITIILVVISTIISIVINILFNDNIWYGYLPIVATVSYSYCVIFGYLQKSANKALIIMKIGLIINGILWAIYGICVKLYPITIFNSITIVLSFISIIRTSKIKV